MIPTVYYASYHEWFQFFSDPGPNALCIQPLNVNRSYMFASRYPGTATLLHVQQEVSECFLGRAAKR